MANPISPLTDDHLTQINNGLTQIDLAEKQIVLAKQAGINVDVAEKQLVDAKTRLIALKRTYFPNS